MIIAIMVLMVAILMAALATQTILLRGSISQYTAQTNSELSYLQGAIGSLLMRESSCRAALGAPANYGTGIFRTAQTFNPAAAENPITIFQQDGVTPLYRGAADPANPLAFEVIGHPRVVIRSIGLRPIRNITKINPATGTTVPSTTWWATLAITAFKPGGLEGASIISRSDLRVSVEIDGANRIVSCTSLSFMGSDQQPLPVCMPGWALYSNGNQIRCVRTICPTGSNPTYYMPSGDVCCDTGGGACLPVP